MPSWSIYLTPNEAERELGLFCLGVGEQEHGPGPAPERALGCYAAVLVRRGRGQLLHGPDRVLHPVDGPAVLHLFPGVLHGYRPATRWDQAWVLFGGPATKALTDLGHLDRDQPVHRSADPRTVERAFARLLRLARTGGSAVQLVAALYELLGQQAPASDDVLDRLRELATRPLSIQGYAAELGLSVAELRAAVRNAAGSTPQEVILTTRLNVAKALLAETDLAVAAVAARVGYGDAAYFSRLFAARVGQSPRSFRRVGSIAAPISSFRRRPDGTAV
ncbi:helix-turn-helix protein [Kribbella amoyensis]|uniref:Helix-turn-helix protein n=1 Tax=Kribbella amoyensis TaxID=996641 RepID=A0A561BSC8_9ACTN|nr:AraC family transcriptional regulator [Kribbella amoyensis]TWD81797.1 helix-turn-helix protein [Kribbella amoyensis]